jgi:hypothetical protein
VLASPLLSFALQAFSFDRDNTAFASHRESATGGRARFSVSRVGARRPWLSWKGRVVRLTRRLSRRGALTT